MDQGYKLQRGDGRGGEMQRARERNGRAEEEKDRLVLGFFFSLPARASLTN